MAPKVTPMEAQYIEAKSRFPDAIMMIRVGDFFELFGDDAVVAAKVLGIALTSRDKKKEGAKPMCGMPHHAVDAYIARLVREGYRVALCDQLEDPKDAKGVVERGVTRVITPGVVLEGDALESTERRLLGALNIDGKQMGAAWIDFSTGEANVYCSDSLADALAWLSRSDIFEYIGSNTTAHAKLVETFGERKIVPFSTGQEQKIDLKEVFWGETRPQLLPGLEKKVVQQAILAAASYIRHIQLGTTPSLRLHQTAAQSFVLDSDSIRNLEVFTSGIEQKRSGSLFDVIDYTATGCGKRYLADLLRNPLLDETSILERQQKIAALVDERSCAESLQSALARCTDLERLAMRLTHGRHLNGRELLAIQQTLEAWQHINSILQHTIFRSTLEEGPSGAELRQKLQIALVDEPALSPAKGEVIRSGYDQELDNHRILQNDAAMVLKQMEDKIQQEFSLPSAKIRQNRVFGYYIELPRSMAKSVPEHFVRKQTLANSERYETDELLQLGEQIMQATEMAMQRENELIIDLQRYLASNALHMTEVGQIIAGLDALSSLAEIAVQNAWVCPTVKNNCTEDNIVGGRHPHLGRSLGSNFISNDTCFHDASKIHILTGPNMGGKSTFLKQIGQLYLLAQIGSFVPVESMTVAPVDQIFTRVGAGDDIARGESTFMVEMRQCAHIIKYSTSRSLLLLDEVGRGTSTFDGLSIAWALVDYIHNEYCPRTVFATHYHELAEQAELLPAVAVFALEVREWEGSIVFLHKVIPGATSHSYGIHVAHLAGLPDSLIRAANNKLNRLETADITQVTTATTLPITTTETSVPTNQLSLFASPHDEILRRLRGLDIMQTTPLDALALLNDLVQKAQNTI